MLAFSFLWSLASRHVQFVVSAAGAFKVYLRCQCISVVCGAAVSSTPPLGAKALHPGHYHHSHTRSPPACRCPRATVCALTLPTTHTDPYQLSCSFPHTHTLPHTLPSHRASCRVPHTCTVSSGWAMTTLGPGTDLGSREAAPRRRKHLLLHLTLGATDAAGDKHPRVPSFLRLLKGVR